MLMDRATMKVKKILASLTYETKYNLTGLDKYKKYKILKFLRPL